MTNLERLISLIGFAPSNNDSLQGAIAQRSAVIASTGGSYAHSDRSFVIGSGAGSHAHGVS